MTSENYLITGAKYAETNHFLVSNLLLTNYGVSSKFKPVYYQNLTVKFYRTVLLEHPKFVTSTLNSVNFLRTTKMYLVILCKVGCFEEMKIGKFHVLLRVVTKKLDFGH